MSKGKPQEPRGATSSKCSVHTAVALFTQLYGSGKIAFREGDELRLEVRRYGVSVHVADEREPSGWWQVYAYGPGVRVELDERRVL